MSKTTTMTSGDRFRDKRNVSTVEASYRLRRYVPPTYQLSYATISRIETGLTKEEDLDTVFVAGLARVYGVELEELSPLHARRAARIAALLTEGLEYAPRDSNPEPSVSLSVVEKDFPRGTWN